MSSVSACPEQSLNEGSLLFPTKCVKQYILYIHIKCEKIANNVLLIDWKRNFIYFNLLMNNKISDIVHRSKSYCKCAPEN